MTQGMGKSTEAPIIDPHPPATHEKITCVLSNKDLWKKFSGHATEMIITKQGR